LKRLLFILLIFVSGCKAVDKIPEAPEESEPVKKIFIYNGKVIIR